MTIAYTDYPIFELGDAPGQVATIREVEALSYDGNKYCTIRVGGPRGVIDTIKSGYLYTEPGRAGEVTCLGREVLEQLPLTYNVDANESAGLTS